MSEKPFHETTAADNKSIGFDYQFYYFLYLLLQLKTGEAIGYEVKDDIHIDRHGGNVVLIQSKHSIGDEEKKEVKNLTERDKDLWKTISNWIAHINDKVSNRGTLTNQLAYLNQVDLILVSNKKYSETNNFLVNVDRYKNGEITISDFKDYLQDLYDKTKEMKDAPNPIKAYIKKMIEQQNDWLSLFLKKLGFYLDEDDLFNRIRGKIHEHFVKENRIDDVMHSLMSRLKMDMYLTVKNRGKYILTYEDFHKQFGKCFENNRTLKLPIRDVDLQVPENLLDQTFIQQLIDLEDISQEDMETIRDLTTCKLKLHNNIEQWLIDGEITSDEIDQFNKNSIRKWQNIFKAAHRGSKRIANIKTSENIETLQTNALICLDKIRECELRLEDTPLDTDMSNGQYYKLSDKPYIGWAYDWEEKYKK